VPDPRVTPDRAAIDYLADRPGFIFDLCPDCDGGGDGMDDCFYCATCKGDQFVCGGCGRRYRECECEDWLDE
jgi:hypothetical protein